jgi:chromosomal replication initiation ATPase DnaA
MNALSDVALIQRIAMIEGELAQLRADAYVRSGIPLPTDCARIARIVDFSATAFSVAQTTIFGPTRALRVCRARFAVMWIAHQAFGFSSVVIGRAIGNRDHSTVLHAFRRVEQWREEDAEYREVTDRLLELVSPIKAREEAENAPSSH